MTETDAERLGQLIRAGRQARNWSTPQLAEAVGANQSTIVRLEQGKFAQPTPRLLQRVVEQLDLPLVQAYALAGFPLPGLQPYLRSAYGLNPADVESVQQYIQQLAAGYGVAGNGPLDGADEQPENN